MTVLTDTVKNDYIGDGTTDAFPYTFKLFREDEMTVTVDSVETNDYTISGIGEDGGGTVTFTTPPALDAAVRLLRVMPYHQIVDYAAYDPFPAESHEMGLDRIVMMLQQIGFELGLVITTSGEEGVVAPPFAAGQYWRWGSTSPEMVADTPVAQTVASASDSEAIDGNNQTFYVFNPEQLKLAVQAHLHSVSTNPKIETVASLPGTPDPNTVYLVTS